MKLTPKIIEDCTGCNSAEAVKFADPLNEATNLYGIIDTKSIAALLANLAVESAMFTKLRENLNYSAEGLARTWPKRYSVGNDGKTPNQLAVSLARQPEKIANNGYASRLGNGNEQSGDGWKYRGVGLIQTTGATNIKAALREIGLPEDSDPEILTIPKNAALSAVYFWKAHGADKAAKEGKFDLTVKIVNGSLPCKANKGDVRKNIYVKALAALGG